MTLITRSDDVYWSKECFVSADDAAEFKLIRDSLRAALEKISELQDTLYSDEDVSAIKKAEDAAHTLYAKMRKDRDTALSRAEELSEAIKRIYTTQMYENKKRESGVSVEMVSAILEAAEIAGCRS
jgi:hypothetical protein